MADRDDVGIAEWESFRLLHLSQGVIRLERTSSDGNKTRMHALRALGIKSPDLATYLGQSMRAGCDNYITLDFVNCTVGWKGDNYRVGTKISDWFD